MESFPGERYLVLPALLKWNACFVSSNLYTVLIFQFVNLHVGSEKF